MIFGRKSQNRLHTVSLKVKSGPNRNLPRHQSAVTPTLFKLFSLRLSLLSFVILCDFNSSVPNSEKRRFVLARGFYINVINFWHREGKFG
ncbi:hypothetical protein VNO78_32758 [Psophocarpus tetragonolobus]|uniref:Uncharacterized protein n=1 Tax=Psophocarpus tetragonolobus TaxID=3891 RepID=A0AAN9RQ93_PSOTE